MHSAIEIIIGCVLFLDWCALKRVVKIQRGTIKTMEGTIKTMEQTIQCQDETIELIKQRAKDYKSRGDNYKQLSEGKPFVIEVNATDFSPN